MIASRFRSVGLVSGVAVAAIGCYMVSLRVAAERAELTELETRIVSTRQDIRTLQTEMGTRGRLSQLERWNTEVLALSSPKSGQYLTGEVQLASFVDAPPPVAPIRIETPAGPRVVQVDYKPEKRVREEAEPAAPVQPLLRQATYIRPPAAAPDPVRKTSLLDDKLLGEIGRRAQAEAKTDTQ